jgi:hypothetical protein
MPFYGHLKSCPEAVNIDLSRCVCMKELELVNSNKSLEEKMKLIYFLLSTLFL